MSSDNNSPAIAETNEQVIARLADDAIHALALIVQKELGVTDGGLASIYYSDDDIRETIKDIIGGHFRLEIEDYCAADRQAPRGEG